VLTFLAVVASAVVGTTASAFAQDVDWKMYGSASVGAPSICFFDNKSVSHTTDSHIRVWTKCLPRQDLGGDFTKTERGKTIIENAARKMIQGYVPPIIAIVRVMDFDQSADVIATEEVANLGDIEPMSRMLFELNCPERMDRRLSTYLNVKGRTVFEDKPSAWQYIAPETNVAYLHKILCPLR
jgi:hypothetical protein